MKNRVVVECRPILIVSTVTVSIPCFISQRTFKTLSWWDTFSWIPPIHTYSNKSLSKGRNPEMTNHRNERSRFAKDTNEQYRGEPFFTIFSTFFTNLPSTNSFAKGSKASFTLIPSLALLFIVPLCLRKVLVLQRAVIRIGKHVIYLIRRSYDFKIHCIDVVRQADVLSLTISRLVKLSPELLNLIRSRWDR